jgi:hypothetical protein
MIAMLALALQAALALPTQDDVRQAVADVAASRCGDATSPASPASLRSRFAASPAPPAGEDMASCRYETRAGAAAWRAATTRFRFDIETQMWFADDAEGGAR